MLLEKYHSEKNPPALSGRGATFPPAFRPADSAGSNNSSAGHHAPVLSRQPSTTPIMKKILFVSSVLFPGFIGCAQEAAGGMALPSAPALTPVTTDAITNFIVSAAATHPWILTALVVIGIMRAVCKPAFDFFHSVVAATPSTKDDELLERVESSHILKWFFWGLDWLGSIKVIHPEAAKTAAATKE